MSDEIKKVNLENAMKISIIGAVLLISLSISYYFVIFLPNQEKKKIEEYKQVEETRIQQEKQQQLNEENIKQKEIKLRKKCSEMATEDAISRYESLRKLNSLFTGEYGTYNKDDYEYAYKKRLRENGLSE